MSSSLSSIILVSSDTDLIPAIEKVRSMKKKIRRRRCKHCDDLYKPDPRNLKRQKFCRKTECKEATKVLGIKPENLMLLDYEVRTFPLHRQEILDDIIKLNNRIKPDLVLVPSSNDIHQDHQTIYKEALRAFKKNSSIWGYEHPWNNLTFTTDIFVKLEEKHIKKKIEALKAYKSQDFRTYFDERYIRALAYTRGTQVNFTYAEAFELVRLLVR